MRVQGKGGILASPDTTAPGGSYYYHWMRDGALAIRSLQETATSWSDVEGAVKAYIGWVVHNMMEPDPYGSDVRAESRFNLPNGDVPSPLWCRPDTDGPGLRAYSLILAAIQLIAGGESGYVQQYLWTGNQSNYNGGAIKYNLDFIAGNYNTTTCDIWGEIRSTDFFWNRITMKKALIAGAAFATAMDDPNSTSLYLATVAVINSTLYATHWTGEFVEETSTRARDSAVILGFNYGHDASDDMFNPASLEVALTVLNYNTLFCFNYHINAADTAAGVPGVLYGRYENDSGNPWVLSTAALASLFYRGAIGILNAGVPNATALSAWEAAFNAPTGSLSPMSQAQLAGVFAAQGDGVLLRLRYHVLADGFNLYDQIDQHTGVQTNAIDFTWSYAEVLTAMKWRTEYLALDTA